MSSAKVLFWVILENEAWHIDNNLIRDHLYYTEAFILTVISKLPQFVKLKLTCSGSDSDCTFSFDVGSIDITRTQS